MNRYILCGLLYVHVACALCIVHAHAYCIDLCDTEGQGGECSRGFGRYGWIYSASRLPREKVVYGKKIDLKKVKVLRMRGTGYRICDLKNLRI